MVSEDDLLYKWSARRFWFKHIYLAYESKNRWEDHKRMMKKK